MAIIGSFIALYSSSLRPTRRGTPIDEPCSKSHWCYDPITGQRVRIAPDRSQRPTDLAANDSQGKLKRCPFCQGSEADTPTELDQLNDDNGNWSTRVVPNRYPAFELPDGSHEVIIESPEHRSHFAELPDEQATKAIQMWARRIRHWRSLPQCEYLLLFKNEGLAAGASLEHLHSQFTALDRAPEDVSAMWQRIAESPTQKLSCERLTISSTGNFSAFSPRAPRAAFETWIACHDSRKSFEDFADSAAESSELAKTVQSVLRKTTQLAHAGGANLVLQVAPNSVANQVARWWIEIAPRSSAMAGFELATNWRINSVSPQKSVEMLKSYFTT